MLKRMLSVAPAAAPDALAAACRNDAWSNTPDVIAMLAESAHPRKGRELTAVYVAIFRRYVDEAEISAADIADRDADTVSEDLVRRLVFVGADPNRLLLTAAICDLVRIGRYIVDKWNVPGIYPVRGDGRIPSVVGSHSQDSATAQFYSHIGAFLGRYRVQVRFFVRDLSTSILLFARELFFCLLGARRRSTALDSRMGLTHAFHAALAASPCPHPALTLPPSSCPHPSACRV